MKDYWKRLKTHPGIFMGKLLLFCVGILLCIKYFMTLTIIELMSINFELTVVSIITIICWGIMLINNIKK